MFRNFVWGLMLIYFTTAGMITNLYFIRMTFIKKFGKFSGGTSSSSVNIQYPLIVAAASQDYKSLVSFKIYEDVAGEDNIYVNTACYGSIAAFGRNLFLQGRGGVV
jgi:hypothetical protein